jgi:esterase/lipase
MDDVRAVMQAVDSERAVVFGMSEGGNMAMVFAATYPERTIALITFGAFATRVYNPDYPWAPTQEQRQKFYDAIEEQWGGPIGIEDLAPSRADDERFRHWWASYQRRSASPRSALTLAKLNTSIDVRHVLPAIRVPTLVLHRTGDRDSNIEEGRYIASHIPDAKFVELPGEDHLLFVGDQDAVLQEVESFISNSGRIADFDSVLATVLYITAKSTAENDETDLHRFPALAKRETEWFKGRLSEANNHTLCATFDGPIRAIKCARAIRDSALEAGIETKTGVHTGLCEIRGDQAAGIAVEISKQVANRAATNEVLLTNTVMDLVSGSGVVFSNRGSFNTERLSGNYQLFATV